MAGIWMGVRDRRPPIPQAVFETREKNLGRVLAGEGVDLTFPIRNTGGKPLHITSVTGSCGCLNPQKPDVVRPGKSDVIRVRFEPSAQWSGQVQKELSVITDDPKEPEVKLHLTADIDPLVAMDPPSPIQIPVHQGQTVTRMVRLTPRKGSGLVLSEPKTASPILKAVLSPPAAADPTGSYQLKLTLGPCKGAADLSAAVMIKTTSEKLPITSVVAVGLQLDGPLVSPAQILFSTIPSGEAGSQLSNLQIFTRGGAEFKVTGVRSSLPELEPKVHAETTGRLYSLQVFRKKPLKPGRHTGQIEIKTNDPKTPRLTVPIDITVS
jgi:hypothetical protein